MLEEVWAWLTTPASRTARRLGLLKESIALDARARRCQEAWAPHFSRSAAVITAAITRVQPQRIVVLGSGQGRDLPWSFLQAQTAELHCVDVVQPRALRKKMAGVARVQLHALDVTGTLDRLVRHAGTVDPPFLASVAAETRSLAARLQDAGIPVDAQTLVISLNLWSQLPLAPCAWLRRRAPRIDEAALNNFAWQILLGHLQGLQALPGPALILADLQQISRKADGSLDTLDFSSGLLPVLEEIDRWRWDLAPLGELPRGEQVHHLVAAGFVRKKSP